MARHAGLLALLALPVAACPPREVTIEISAAGASTLISTCGDGVRIRATAILSCNDFKNSCDRIAAPCAQDACDEVETLCDKIDKFEIEASDCDAFGTTCEEVRRSCINLDREFCERTMNDCKVVANALDQVCGVQSLSRPEFCSANAGTTTRFAARVALVPAVGMPPIVASACAPFEVDCAPGDTFSAQAFADGANEALQAAIADGGLGFDGLEAAEDTQPMLLLFHGDDAVANCERESLFACASLGRRVPSADSYDIICGSCQEGLKPTVATPPCATECLLSYCMDVADAL